MYKYCISSVLMTSRCPRRNKLPEKKVKAEAGSHTGDVTCTERLARHVIPCAPTTVSMYVYLKYRRIFFFLYCTSTQCMQTVVVRSDDAGAVRGQLHRKDAHVRDTLDDVGTKHPGGRARISTWVFSTAHDDETR
jgi:hypothetical protein